MDHVFNGPMTTCSLILFLCSVLSAPNGGERQYKVIIKTQDGFSRNRRNSSVEIIQLHFQPTKLSSGLFTCVAVI